MTPFLAVRGLSLSLSDAFTLKDVSLSLARGERLVVLGPSGCGKTTLLRCLCGLSTPDAGTIALEGRDLTRLPPEARDVGYVPQAATLFPHLDVAENVAFGLRSMRVAPAERARRTEEALALARAGPLSRRLPGTLSGGEAKRVALARSLAPRPAVLLLDEPLAMLDGQARDDMVEVLSSTLAATGTTTVHVTHDREEAWLLAGTCAVMEAGRIRQIGPIGDVFRKPRSRFTAEFLGGANVLPAEFTDGGRAKVAGALLPLTEPAGPGPGWVVVRPEDLGVGTASEEAHFAGGLLSVSDRGAYAALRVKVTDSVTLVAHVPPASVSDLAAGERVRLVLRGKAHPLGGGDA